MASLYLPSCSALVPRPKRPNPLLGARSRSREKQLTASSCWTPLNKTIIVCVKNETECVKVTFYYILNSSTSNSIDTVTANLMHKTTVSYLFWGSENKGLQVDNFGSDRRTAWTHMPLSFWLLLVVAKVREDSRQAADYKNLCIICRSMRCQVVIYLKTDILWQKRDIILTLERHLT